jgi:predicted transcriptional regulator of viral defense system
MTISGWIENREMTGFPTFSYQEVSNAFPTLSSNVVSNKLCLLGKQKRIQTVHKQFYTVVPIQFKDRGIVPPYNYVDQLMTYLRRPYYISLLSAGVLHGAAHQRPQR